MWYALGGSTLLAILFAVLFIRSAINNGKINQQLTESQQNADKQKKLLDIAANHPDTPDSLAKRMREGTL